MLQDYKFFKIKLDIFINENIIKNKYFVFVFS